MSVNTYTPDSTKIIHNTSVDFVTRYINAPVHLVQFDNSSPIVAVKLYSNGTPYVIPNGMDVNVRVKKPDGTIVYNHVLGCNADRNEIYFDATTQMCVVDGEIYPIIEITNGTVVAASGYILVQVDKNPVNDEDIKSSSEAKAIDEYVQYAKSWAVGDTGIRVGENTDNSKFYAEQSALNETQASVYANDAARSAINAEDSADNAKASEDNAKASEEAAAQSLLDAQAEVRKAEAEVVKAKAEVENAQAEVVKAQTEVANAKEEVTKAKGYADNAEANAVIAAHAADSAQTDAINAANSASTAQMYAENAEAIVGIGIATTDKAGILKPDGTSSWVDPDGTLHTAAGEANMNTKDYVEAGGTGVVLKSRKVGEADTEILEGFSEDPETGHLLYNDKPIASESDGLYTNNKAQYEEDASKVSDGTAVIITDDMDDDEDMSTDYVNPDHFEFQNGVMSISEKVTAKISKLDDDGEVTKKIANISNPNLLENSWFNINSKGFTSASTTWTPTVDNWGITDKAVTVSKATNGITLTSGAEIFQNINATLINGRKYVFSGVDTQGNTVILPFTMPSVPPTVWSDSISKDGDTFRLIIMTQRDGFIWAVIHGLTDVTIRNVKLELGEVSTIQADTIQSSGFTPSTLSKEISTLTSQVILSNGLKSVEFPKYGNGFGIRAYTDDEQANGWAFDITSEKIMFYIKTSGEWQLRWEK